MRKNIGVLTAVLGAFFGTQTLFADQLVTNGGFETGDLSGWTATGDVTSSDFASQFYGVDTLDAAAGTYGAYLGSEFAPLTLSQTLTVQPGHYYDVSFSLAQNSAPATGFTNSFVASFAGQTFFSVTNAPVSAFTNYSFTVSTSPGASTAAVLQLTSQNDLGYFSLDNVSVSTGAATPEPATFLLIAPGVGVLALLRRKTSLRRAAIDHERP